MSGVQSATYFVRTTFMDEPASVRRYLNPAPERHEDGTPSAAHVSLSNLNPGHVGTKLRLIGQMTEITDRFVLLSVPGERSAVVVDLRVPLLGRQYELLPEEERAGAGFPGSNAPKKVDPFERAARRGQLPNRQPLTLGRLAWIDVTGWLYPLPDEIKRQRVVRQWLRGRERSDVVLGLLEAIHVQNGFEPPRDFDFSSVYDDLDDD